MDLIMFTMNRIKEIVHKIKNIFSFIKSNYLPDYENGGFGDWFLFK